jgi:curved DNA-binding protein CbpA
MTGEDSSDHYEALGVPPDASGDEIRAAYKWLSRKFHPDQNPGDERATMMMKRVNAAFAVLGDAAQRKKFDQQRSAGNVVGTERAPAAHTGLTASESPATPRRVSRGAPPYFVLAGARSSEGSRGCARESCYLWSDSEASAVARRSFSSRATPPSLCHASHGGGSVDLGRRAPMLDRSRSLHRGWRRCRHTDWALEAEEGVLAVGRTGGDFPAGRPELVCHFGGLPVIASGFARIFPTTRIGVSTDRGHEERRGHTPRQERDGEGEETFGLGLEHRAMILASAERLSPLRLSPNFGRP